MVMLVLSLLAGTVCAGQFSCPEVKVGDTSICPLQEPICPVDAQQLAYEPYGPELDYAAVSPYVDDAPGRIDSCGQQAVSCIRLCEQVMYYDHVPKQVPLVERFKPEHIVAYCKQLCGLS